jgi:hypothetical protein
LEKRDTLFISALTLKKSLTRTPGWARGVIRCGLKGGEMRHARRRPAAAAFFHARVPEPDPGVARAGELVDRVLQDPTEKFNAGDQPDWVQLALDLGYFDQAHLINNLKSIVGY